MILLRNCRTTDMRGRAKRQEIFRANGRKAMVVTSFESAGSNPFTVSLFHDQDGLLADGTMDFGVKAEALKVTAEFLGVTGSVIDAIKPR